MALLPALVGTAQAGAVEYKSTYRSVNTRPLQVAATTTTAAPSAAFQSTSAYSRQWNSDPSSSLLNSDGSVNSGAYMSSGPHYAKKDGVGDPSGGIDPPDDDDDDNTENGTPLGDGLLLLLALALVYALARRKTRIQEP